MEQIPPGVSEAIMNRPADVAGTIIVAFIMGLVGSAERVGMDFYTAIYNNLCQDDYTYCSNHNCSLSRKLPTPNLDAPCAKCLTRIKAETVEKLKTSCGRYIYKKCHEMKTSAVLGYCAIPKELSGHYTIVDEPNGTQNVRYTIDFDYIRETLVEKCFARIINSISDEALVQIDQLETYKSMPFTTFDEKKKVIDCLIILRQSLPQGNDIGIDFSDFADMVIIKGGVPISWNNPLNLTLNEPDTKPSVGIACAI